MPTTKTTITITDLQDAAGNLLGNAWLTVRLNAGPNGGVVDGSVIAASAKVQTDADGDATLTLYPNDAITPADSYYTISVDETSPLIYRTIEVPSGGGTYDWSAAEIQVTAVPFDGPYPGGNTGSGGQVVARKASGDGFELVDHNSIAGRSTAGAHPATAVSVPSGTMPTIDASVPPGSTALSAYLTSVDTSLAGLGSSLVSTATAVGEAQADADSAQATADAALAAANDGAIDFLRSEVAERQSTAPRFQLCNGATHPSGGYTTDAPADFSGGFYARFTATALSDADLPTSPSDGDLVYSEIFTQTADGIGVWDNFEIAVQWLYDADRGMWRPTLFFEWTEEGGSTEAHSLGTDGTSSAAGVTYQPWDFPLDVPTEIAVDLDFSNADSKWDLSFWRRTYQPSGGTAFDGAEWVRISRAIGTTTTSIDTGVTEPWGFGFGSGGIELFELTVRNGSSSGTVLAAPTAALAYAEGDGQPFDDPQSNTWTPGADAAVVVPASGGGGVADGSVTTAKLADSAVTSAKIANGTIVAADLAADLAALIPTEYQPSGDVSSTSATPLTAIEIPVTAGYTYKLSGLATASGSNAADALIGFTHPGGTIRVGVGALSTAASSSPGTAQTSPTIIASGGQARMGLVADLGPAAIAGKYVCTTTGTLTMTWCQLSTNATASVLEAAGTYLDVTSYPTPS